MRFEKDKETLTIYITAWEAIAALVFLILVILLFTVVVPALWP